jgi:hypothetical protein
MSVWFRTQISKTVVLIPVDSTAVIGITIQDSSSIHLISRKLQNIEPSAACAFPKLTTSVPFAACIGRGNSRPIGFLEMCANSGMAVLNAGS